MQTQDHAYRSPDIVRFLCLLMCKIHGHLLINWDGLPMHRGQAIKAFLPNGAANRLRHKRMVIRGCILQASCLARTRQSPCGRFYGRLLRRTFNQAVS